MTARPVEAVMAIFYGPTTHQVTYGRKVQGGGYTRDFIQLSKRAQFITWAQKYFPRGVTGTSPITFQWPGGSTPGDFVYLSSDRPHLKWDTRVGAPLAWRMTPSPSELTAQTLPGNPEHDEFAMAEAEFAALRGRGAGQPYLLAVKLRDEPGILHVRAYLDGPSGSFEWANLNQTPFAIQDLARRTTKNRTLAWESFDSSGVPPTSGIDAALEAISSDADVNEAVSTLPSTAVSELLPFLHDPGQGLFFDPDKNHNAWLQAPALPDDLVLASPAIIELLTGRSSPSAGDDQTAEQLPVDEAQVETFREQIATREFSVPDTIAAVKTRGSAQKAFADAVKSNYGDTCAVTGVTTRAFLVASHIVPWSEDQTIRLDPSNGICLSLVIDRAFESGHLRVEDDLTIHVDRGRVGTDEALLRMLEPYDGQALRRPGRGLPNVDYLRRRREIVDRRA